MLKKGMSMVLGLNLVMGKCRFGFEILLSILLKSMKIFDLDLFIVV